MDQLLYQQLQTIGELKARLLPRELPQPLGWRVCAYHRTGRRPGGDYYDFLPLPGGRLALFVADGGEDGVRSLLLVGMVRVALHACPLSSGREHQPYCPFSQPVLQPPHVLLDHLNRVIGEDALDGQSLAAFVGHLDLTTGFLQYANAGLPRPRWWREREQCLETLRDATGLPLGLESHTSSYHRRWVEIAPDDLLVFHTDGLTAALDRRGRSFGGEQLDVIVREAAVDGADALLTAVVERLDAHLAKADPDDDVTVLVVQRVC